jgi:hypothetical protein
MSLSNKYPHYFKDVSKIDKLDIYTILMLYRITDPCIGHAIKKLLVAGGRGAKDVTQDIQEAIDTLTRWQELQQEESLDKVFLTASTVVGQAR